MDDKTPDDGSLLSVAAKIGKPLSLAALGIIVLYLLYRLLLSLDIFPTLSQGSAMKLLTQFMNFVFIVALVALVLGVIAYLVTKSWERKPKAKPTATFILLTGNVYYPGELKAPGATIRVDAMLGNTMSNADGFFALQVYPRDEYIVHAEADGWAGKVTVKRKQAEKPVIITLAQVSSASVPPPSLMTPTASEPAATPTARADSSNGSDGTERAVRYAPPPLLVSVDDLVAQHLTDILRTLKDQLDKLPGKCDYADPLIAAIASYFRGDLASAKAAFECLVYLGYLTSVVGHRYELTQSARDTMAKDRHQ